MVFIPATVWCTTGLWIISLWVYDSHTTMCCFAEFLLPRPIAMLPLLTHLHPHMATTLRMSVAHRPLWLT